MAFFPVQLASKARCIRCQSKGHSVCHKAPPSRCYSCSPRTRCSWTYRWAERGPV